MLSTEGGDGGEKTGRGRTEDEEAEGARLLKTLHVPIFLSLYPPHLRGSPPSIRGADGIRACSCSQQQHPRNFPSLGILLAISKTNPSPSGPPVLPQCQSIHKQNQRVQ